MAGRPQQNFAVSRVRATALGWNTNLLKGAAVPRGYADLLDPALRHRIVIVANAVPWFFAMHRALGENRIFALGPADPDPACLVEQAVNSSLESALREAEALLLQRLADVSLADIAADFDRRFVELSPDDRAN